MALLLFVPGTLGRSGPLARAVGPSATLPATVPRSAAAPPGVRCCAVPAEGSPRGAPTASGGRAAAVGTPYAVTATAGVGSDPVAVATAGGQAFVVNEGSDSVSVVSEANGTVLATVPVGSEPDGIAYASSVYEMYVANSASGNVSVISTGNDTVVATVELPYAEPTAAVTYNPALEEVIVGESGVDGDQLAVICVAKFSPCYPGTGTPPELVAYAVLGSGLAQVPTAAQYDAWDGQVFVVEGGSDSVAVVALANETLLTTLSVGRSPAGVAYDETTGEVFVANSGSDNLSVIANATDTVVGAIADAGDPTGVALDPALGEVFVTDRATGNVSDLAESGAGAATVVPVAYLPSAVAFDSGTGAWVVANSGSDTASVITLASAVVTGTVAVPLDPWGVAYDPSAGQVFVTNRGNAPDNVTVISEANDTAVATIAVGDSPAGLAYDSGRQELFVANSADGTVSVISVAHADVVATIPVGDVPLGVAYDPGRGEIFVTNDYSFTVSVINDTNDTVVATIPVGENPQGIAYDPAAGEVFVVNYEGANVSVISDRTDRVLESVPVGSNPVGAAYDAGLGEVFVTNAGADNVSVISGTGSVVGSVPVGAAPGAAAYDPATGEVFVADSGAENVSVIWDATDTVVATVPVGLYPEGIAYDPEQGRLFVANEGSSNVSVLSAPAPTSSVTFQETGLPGGSRWTVALSGGPELNSTTSVLSFQVAPGNLSFAIAPAASLVPNTTSGEIRAVGWAVVILVGFAAPRYPVTFVESVLPPGTEWWANISGQPSQNTTASSLVTALPNGSYTFSVAAVGPNFTATGVGAFAVAGAAVEVEPDFVTTLYYAVRFTETGLPSSTAWWINVTGRAPESSTATSITVSLANGSYTFQASAANWQYAVEGSSLVPLTVAGSALSVGVPFGFEPYTVSFTEEGLTLGTAWSVSVAGSSQTSRTAAMAFAEESGSYPYTVGAVAGFSALPSTGTASVGSANLTVAVTFSATSDLSVELLASPNASSGPEPAPLNVSLSASVTGGTPPYSYAWSLGDNGTATGPPPTYHVYYLPGTYLVSLTVTDAVGASRTATALVSVGTPGEVSGWVPAWDAYSFGNLGSVWSAVGNCYGLSSTEVLYYDRSDLGVATDPYLPDDATYYPAPLPNLASAAAPPVNSGGDWDSFDNVSLAIYLHQVSALNRVDAAWNNTLAASMVLSALQQDHEPVVVALGPTNLHAVVIYGAQTYANGSVEFAISDPNSGVSSNGGGVGVTSHAWFVPPSTFSYHYYDRWSDFGEVSIGPFWTGAPVSGAPDPWAVSTLTGGWQLVESTAAVTVSAHGTDAFADDDGGDSQTFVQGIHGSAGIEELGTAGQAEQAFLVPPGAPAVTIDPPSSSVLRIVYGASDAGVPSLEGVQLNVSSASDAPYTLQRTVDGVRLETNASAVAVNLTVFFENATAWDLLNASELSVGADQVAVLRVESWTGLNATATASATLEIGNASGTGPQLTYDLRNGQTGLGAPVGAGGSSSRSSLFGGAPWATYAVGGAMVAAAVLGVVLVLRSRSRRPPVPARPVLAPRQPPP